MDSNLHVGIGGNMFARAEDRSRKEEREGRGEKKGREISRISLGHQRQQAQTSKK